MNTSNDSIIDKTIVKDNEMAARSAYQRGDYVSCFLLIHSLIEALLRAFLTKTKRERFSDLIAAYEEYLQQEKQPRSTFVDELTDLIEFFLTLPYIWEDLKLERTKERLALIEKIIEILKTLEWDKEQIDRFVEPILQNLLKIKDLTNDKKLPLPKDVRALPQPRQQEVLALLKQAGVM